MRSCRWWQQRIMESCPLGPLSNEPVASVHTLPLDVNGLYSQRCHCVETLIAEIPLDSGPLFYVTMCLFLSRTSLTMLLSLWWSEAANSGSSYCFVEHPLLCSCMSFLWLFTFTRRAVGNKAKQIQQCRTHRSTNAREYLKNCSNVMIIG